MTPVCTPPLRPVVVHSHSFDSFAVLVKSTLTLYIKHRGHTGYARAVAEEAEISRALGCSQVFTGNIRVYSLFYAVLRPPDTISDHSSRCLHSQPIGSRDDRCKQCPGKQIRKRLHTSVLAQSSKYNNNDHPQKHDSLAV